MLGGHMRVGLEDNLRVTRAKERESNAALVSKAMTLAPLLDREPASASDARRCWAWPPRRLTGGAPGRAGDMGLSRAGRSLVRRGARTRSEVREIFAHHAERAGGSAAPPGEEQRRRPMPGFLSLPVRGWRSCRAAAMAVALLIAAALAAFAVVVPPALQNSSENAENQRRASPPTANASGVELVEQQRPPHRAGAAGARSATELAVGADVRRRVRAGTLDGPAGATTCRPVRAGEPPGARSSPASSSRASGGPSATVRS